MAEIRKIRGEAVLDLKLSSDEQKAFFDVVEKNTLEFAQEFLWSTHEQKLSVNTISRWAAKRRARIRDLAFQEHLIEVAGATATAEKFGEELKRAGAIDAANIALLRKAYHTALILKDIQSIEFFSDKYTQALNAITSKQRADAAMMSAETGRETLKLKITTAIDTGLNALFEEVKNIPEAAQLFEKIRALVSQAKEAA
jgi:hypothetical protein